MPYTSHYNQTNHHFPSEYIENITIKLTLENHFVRLNKHCPFKCQIKKNALSDTQTIGANDGKFLFEFFLKNVQHYV